MRTARTSISRASRRHFGGLLQAAREASGLDKGELARRAGVPIKYIQALEKGHGRLERCRIIDIGQAITAPSEFTKAIAEWKENQPFPAVIVDPECGRQFFLRAKELVREARRQNGLSVRELGRRSGLDPTYLSRLERGQVKAPSLRNIAVIASQLPDSELARRVRAVDAAEELKDSALKLERDLEKLLISVPLQAFADPAWVATMKNRLGKCLRIIGASERQARTGA